MRTSLYPSFIETTGSLADEERTRLHSRRLPVGLATLPEIDPLDQSKEVPLGAEVFEGIVLDDRYRLDRKIGAGGFGVVFAAFDLRLSRRVAIKVLSPEVSLDDRVRTRFRREALALRRIRHPGIVYLHDFSVGNGPHSYIVMEHLRGQDLAMILEVKGLLHPRLAAGYISQAARALAESHLRGVLHRDLKPANLFVHQGSPEQIKIIDFGIAMDTRNNPRTLHITSASRVVGTPLYMAPEQACGSDLDGRADLYSLGCILYELLCGLRPVDGSTVAAIMMAHSKAPRLPPSQRRQGLAISPELEDIVLRAIEPQRASRFADMSAFADALDQYLAGDALESLESSTSLRAPKRSATVIVRGPTQERRHSAKIALALAATAMLLGSLLWQFL